MRAHALVLGAGVAALLASAAWLLPAVAQTASPPPAAVTVERSVPAPDRDSLAAIDEAWSEVYLPALDAHEPVPFSPPSEADIPEGAFGDSVRAGLAIFRDPQTHAAGYVGNGLKCVSCHLDDGRRPAAAPMWAAYPLYPMYRSKNHAVNTIERRIQGCFRFSMNGTPPPEDSEIVANLVSYFFWLSRFAPIGAELPGRGYPDVPEPASGYDIARGETLYAQYCAACHGSDGQGTKVEGTSGYQFPPLWGAESYNWGAGMQKLSTAAGFIKANMPYGLRNAVSDQEAWDLASYINSQERPQDPRFTGSVEETRERFHRTDSLYGTVQHGVLLGDPASVPKETAAAPQAALPER